MLPGRLGLRFALEALFLVLLAIGAGLADLRPGLILLVMAIAWVLVAVIEFTAERIAASPLNYFLPPRGDPPRASPSRSWPMPEERTVVAPPERPPSRQAASPRRSGPEPEPEPELPADEPASPSRAEPASPVAAALVLRRARAATREPEAATPPRHVKLLPRRSAPEPSRASQEVAELFDRAPRTSREDPAGEARLSLIRFLLEAGFLVLVAAAAGLAGLAAMWIGVVMFGAWLLVALVERTGSRRRRASRARRRSRAGGAEPEPEPEPEPPSPNPSQSRNPSPSPSPSRSCWPPPPTCRELHRSRSGSPSRRPTVAAAGPARSRRASGTSGSSRTARDAATGDRDREEELLLLIYLRDFATPDGQLPVDFDDLVRESFGDWPGASA